MDQQLPLLDDELPLLHEELIAAGERRLAQLDAERADIVRSMAVLGRRPATPAFFQAWVSHGGGTRAWPTAS